MTTTFESDDGPGRRPVSLQNLALGVTLIAVGILLTLDRLEVLHFGQIHRLWPLFLIALGLARLATAGQRHSGLTLLGVGLIFGAQTAGLASMRQLWPLFLVLGGVSLLTRTWDDDECGLRRARHGRRA